MSELQFTLYMGSSCSRIFFKISVFLENTCEIWETFRNTSFYRTPPVAASFYIKNLILVCCFHKFMVIHVLIIAVVLKKEKI